jgi:hypothetical protein
MPTHEIIAEFLTLKRRALSGLAAVRFRISWEAGVVPPGQIKALLRDRNREVQVDAKQRVPVAA